MATTYIIPFSIPIVSVNVVALPQSHMLQPVHVLTIATTAQYQTIKYMTKFDEFGRFHAINLTKTTPHKVMDYPTSAFTMLATKNMSDATLTSHPGNLSDPTTSEALGAICRKTGKAETTYKKLGKDNALIKDLHKIAEKVIHGIQDDLGKKVGEIITKEELSKIAQGHCKIMKDANIAQDELMFLAIETACKEEGYHPKFGHNLYNDFFHSDPHLTDEHSTLVASHTTPNTDGLHS